MSANIVKPRNFRNSILNIIITFARAKLRFKAGTPVPKVVLKELPILSA